VAGPLPETIATEPKASSFKTKLWSSIKTLPFLSMHLACLAAFFTGVNTLGIVLCGVCYFIRMFGITAGYHRYFAHRSYKTSRFFQFAMAWLGCSAMQKGPLWWAAHHRMHHRYSDTDDDPHSPLAKSIWWSHIGWVLDAKNDPTGWEHIRDWSRYPELRWLNRNHWVPGITLAVLCYLIDGWIGLVWGFFISTVMLYHGVFLVNSMCHILGKRRFATSDDSRNNWFVALVTLGEGWHNNHHHYQSSVNQGFFWWEIDVSYYMLRILGLMGLVWSFRKPPAKMLRPESEQVEPTVAAEAVVVH
jgi:stearoyl-CoA desaturase (delta-9 desaturase)